ncbi:MAG: MlaE family ABC transporter permease [Pseudobdellovibrionaceae bacterium]
MIEKTSRRMDELWESIAVPATAFVRELGDIVLFGITSIRLSFTKPYRYTEIIKHMEFVGNQSVFIVALTALFTGLALSFQLYLGFKLFNAVNMVGPTVALGITRELGPVLTGLIVAARAGGAMAARLGTMRVNEQIDALDVMGVNTKQYLIAPRIYAAVICMPLLTAIFDFVAMLGAYILCVKLVDLDEAVFWDRVNQMIAIRHINEGLFKSAIFGGFFALICTYRGFNTTGGAKGVGDATNKGVVASMVMIIILDYFLTNVFIRSFYSLTGIPQ